MKKTGGSGPGDSLQIRSGKEQGNFHHRMMVSRKPTFFFLDGARNDLREERL